MPSNARIIEMLTVLPPASGRDLDRQQELLDNCIISNNNNFKKEVFATKPLFNNFKNVDNVFKGNAKHNKQSFLTNGPNDADLDVIRDLIIFKRAMFSLESADEGTLKSIVDAGVADDAVTAPTSKTEVATILATNPVFGKLGAGVYDRVTDARRQKIAAQAQVLLNQKVLDRQVYECLQKFNKARGLLETNLTFIADSRTTPQNLVDHPDVIDVSLTQLKELQQQLTAIDGIQPRPASAVSPTSSGLGLGLAPSTPYTLNTHLEEQIETFKKQVDDNATKLIAAAKINLGEIENLRTADTAPEGRTHDELIANVVKATKKKDSIVNTLALMTESDCDLSVIQAIHDDAQLALVQLQIRSASQLAKQPLAVPPLPLPPAPLAPPPAPPVLLGQPGVQSALDELETIKVELVKARVLDPNFDTAAQLIRANLLLSEIKKNIQQAQKDIAVAKDTIPATKALTVNDDARVADLQTQLDKAFADHAAIKNRLHSSKEGNAFIAKNDSLDDFNVGLVKAAERLPTSNYQLPAKAPVVLAVTGGSPVFYQKVQLEKDDIIRAEATFPHKSSAPVATTALAPITARLEQDHQGKVSDVTADADYAKLSDEQKSLVALKQAKMVLDNYEPGRTKEIVVSGGDVNLDKANRVYAALLYLKRENPKLDGIAIISRVNGCEVPKNMLVPDFVLRNRFIEEHFSGHLIQNKNNAALLPVDRKQMLQTVVSDVGKVVEKRDNRQAAYKQRYNDAKTVQDKVAVEKTFSRPEGSEVKIDHIDNIDEDSLAP